MSRNIRLAVTVGGCMLILGLLGVREVTSWITGGRAIDVVFEQGDDYLVFDYVGQGQPADRAGIREGDVLIAIDGRRIPDVMAYDRVAAGFERGRPVRFDLRREGRDHTVEVRPGTPFEWLNAAVNAVACLVYLALAVMVTGQAPTESRGRLLALFSGAVALELAMPISLIGFPGWDQVIFPFLFLLYGAQIGLEIQLAASIPEPPPWRRRLPWAIPLAWTIGMGLGVFHAFTQIHDFRGWDFLPWDESFASLVFWDIGLPCWALTVVCILAIQAFRWPEPLGRQQAALVLIGSLPWAVMVFLGLFLDASFSDNMAWVDLLDTIALLIYPIAIFLAIFRYRLFDLEMVVKRGMLFTAMAATLAVVFYAVAVSAGAIVSVFLPASTGLLVAVAAAALTMGLVFSPLRDRLQEGIERRFFPERRALRQHLVDLAGSLPARGTLSAMGKELVGRLCGIFDLEWAAVLMAEGRSGLLNPVETHGMEAIGEEPLLLYRTNPGIEQLKLARRPVPVDRLAGASESMELSLKRQRAELLVPLLKNEELLGVLALGKKRSGENFLGEELELLDLLSHHVTAVFEGAQLFESATRDGLTGLLRREAILEHLDKELRRAERFDRTLTIGMADLDHFKGINDRHGHVVGDLMLKRVAAAMKENLRTSDDIGRYGGEEFLLVLTETGVKGAYTVASKVREGVEALEIKTSRTGAARVTLSIGLAGREALEAGREHDVERLIELADRALYAAKSAGRNRVDTYGGGL